MPPDPAPLGIPAEWIARARSDLALAKITLPVDARYEDLCFHAQQAAEKAIKAVCRQRGLRFPYSHNLRLLLDGIRNQGIPIPPEIDSAAALTEYASQTRYPGVSEPVTEDDRAAAVRAAEAVVTWAERIVAEAKP